jgi:hypothetical protein
LVCPDQGVRDAEGVDEGDGVGAEAAEEGVDLGAHGLRLRRVEVVLLEEPPAVAFEDPQRVERAQPA